MKKKHKTWMQGLAISAVATLGVLAGWAYFDGDDKIEEAKAKKAA